MDKQKIYAVVCVYSWDPCNYVRFFDNLESAKKLLQEIVKEEIEEASSDTDSAFSCEIDDDGWSAELRWESCISEDDDVEYITIETGELESVF